jgi:hypothetical protein
MMEGYFVRTLGMHRVYNSAFMNMLKNEENGKYRATIKNTLEFDPEILKRFVNFMNNPDEDTAVAQFGKGDKYFGICTLLVTMPGLPMFGHGQIEGFEEKYGMEYRRAYRDEGPDGYLVDRHEREIFPLMKKRHIFSGSADFRLYDFFSSEGHVNENVFAYSNRDWEDRALVLYNNSYHEASGRIKQSSPAIPQEDGGLRQDTLTEALSIHGEDRYFSFFHEQRSGLWFIRSSKELCEQGLFVALKGYEAQVFLDIHEREDGIGGPWTRRWSRLNHELGGRGVPDPDAAAADLFLDAIYRPFAEIFDPRRVRALEAAVESGDSGAPDSLPQDFVAPVTGFIRAAAEYLDGAGGAYEPFAYPGLAPAKPEAAGGAAETTGPAARGNAAAKKAVAKKAAAGKSAAKNAAAPGPGAVNRDAGPEARALAQFSAFLERLSGIGKSPAAEALGPLAAAMAGVAAGGAGGLATGVATPAGASAPVPRRELTAYALGYGALALLRAVFEPELPGRGARALALLGHWQLDRKLGECFRGLGLNGGESRRVLEIMKALLGRTCAAAAGPAGTARPAPKSPAIPGETDVRALAAAYIAENYEAGDFRRLLGVNRFNDVTWFNKEGYEETLFYLSCFLLIEDDDSFGPGFAGGTGRAAAIAEFGRAMLEAEKNSGYRLDELVKALSEA